MNKLFRALICLQLSFDLSGLAGVVRVPFLRFSSPPSNTMSRYVEPEQLHKSAVGTSSAAVRRLRHVIGSRSARASVVPRLTLEYFSAGRR
jgi:hypothetical protein